MGYYMKKITLVSAELMHQRYPKTFELLPEEERKNIEAGNHVKVGIRSFMGDETTERLWVKVTEVKQDGKFIGSLRNDPVLVGLKYGDEIEFEACHIYCIERTD